MKLTTMIHILTHGEGLSAAFIGSAEDRLASVDDGDMAVLAAALAAAKANHAPAPDPDKKNKQD
jgi:hypothetical protein